MLQLLARCHLVPPAAPLPPTHCVHPRPSPGPFLSWPLHVHAFLPLPGAAPSCATGMQVAMPWGWQPCMEGARQSRAALRTTHAWKPSQRLMAPACCSASLAAGHHGSAAWRRRVAVPAGHRTRRMLQHHMHVAIGCFDVNMPAWLEPHRELPASVGNELGGVPSTQEAVSSAAWQTHCRLQGLQVCTQVSMCSTYTGPIGRLFTSAAAGARQAGTAGSGSLLPSMARDCGRLADAQRFLRLVGASIGAQQVAASGAAA